MFFRKTVDSLLAGITRGISDLREVGEQKAADANEFNRKAREFDKASDEAAAEADRAFTLADRFENLITVKEEENL